MSFVSNKTLVLTIEWVSVIVQELSIGKIAGSFLLQCSVYSKIEIGPYTLLHIYVVTSLSISGENYHWFYRVEYCDVAVLQLPGSTQIFVLPIYCTILYSQYSLLRISVLNLYYPQKATGIIDVYSVADYIHNHLRTHKLPDRMYMSTNLVPTRGYTEIQSRICRNTYIKYKIVQ